MPLYLPDDGETVNVIFDFDNTPCLLLVPFLMTSFLVQFINLVWIFDAKICRNSIDRKKEVLVIWSNH